MKPLLVNTEMALAIQEGRKTVTRRAIKFPEYFDDISITVNWIGDTIHDVQIYDRDTEEAVFVKPSYKKGDILWLREPVRVLAAFTEELHFEYLSDGKQSSIPMPTRLLKNGYTPDWMIQGHGVPNGCIKEMARTFVLVTDVRTEYLQDIGTLDIQNEGISLECYPNDSMQPRDRIRDRFQKLWNKVAPRGYKWDDNPLVWRIGLKKSNDIIKEKNHG